MKVVFATNDKGYRFLKVAVHSLVSNVNPAGAYEICVLEGEGGVGAEHKADLEHVVNGRFPIRWIDVDPYLDAHRAELEAINKGRTLMIWARIFCGEIFGDADENMLYLDTDVLVAGDLAELFKTDLGPNLVGMVPEADRRCGGGTFRRVCIPAEVVNYCNSGVLLFNPKSWRRADFSRCLLAWVARWWKDSKCPDQDAINALFYDRTTYLPPKWNYHDGWVERSLKLRAGAKTWLGNDPLDVLEAIQNPRILHYWGARKPWKFNHRPERLRYERAMREMEMLDGALVGSTFLKRRTLPFWDGLHGLVKAIDRLRLRRLRRKRGLPS